MAREYAAEKMSYPESPAEKSYEEKTDEISGDEMERSPNIAGNMKKDYVVWPSLPHIVPLDEGSTEGGDSHSVYTVESPSGSPMHENMAPKGRASCRQFQKLERVEETATNRLKKRDAEGLLKEEDRSKFQAGVKRLAYAAATLADRSHL
ncbi:uncharacterized protein [Aegilops tauschii subsp. strangulata]|uniref:uncharacterized protein n=1 Tax=Aegilops tauschii subsp. strangulata TaxID=200361 RepID=UPI003CC8B5E4